MFSEIMIIGLQLAILASLSGKGTVCRDDDKKPAEVKSEAHRRKASTPVKVAPPKTISNSGERFVQCPLEGYRSYFMVGDMGTIKQVNGKVLAQHRKSQMGNKEYVNLYTGTKDTTFTVERLVALAFLVPPAKLDGKRHRIIHKNGDVHDNRATNLMWR